MTDHYRDRHHNYHTAVFANCTASTPKLRTVVIRHIDFDTNQIQFHTDIRSPKCSEIQSSNLAALLFYDTHEKIQLRLSVAASIEHQNAITQNRWQQMSRQSKRCYLSQYPPGHTLSEPMTHLPSQSESSSPTDQMGEHGYQHFAIITCHIKTIDYLQLNSNGHQRALFTWNIDKQVEGKWIAP
tara:strand:- start:1775 stop:2326 length:552 start_codon:yes stop_codon:yes gene_type:complete